MALEKKVREEKKKKRQEDKKADEELTKAQREATLTRPVMVATAISPPSDIEEEYVPLPKDSPLFEMTAEELTDYATGFLGLSEEDADNYVAQVQEQKESFEFLENEVLLSDDEEAADHLDHLARHGVQANNLFGDDIQEVATPIIDISENSPEKKKTRSIAGAQKKYNRYTTKGFTIPPTAHAHTYPLTYVEAAICLTSDDKPKEFIVAIKLILKNAKYLDPNFGLAPLKNLPGGQKKIIMAEDDVPTNFTHLGQYAFTSGNRVFEKKKDWKKEKKLHRDKEAEDLKDPVVYFTIAIAMDIAPRALIDGIRMEWETHGGGKFQVKDLQSHDSKSMFALYFVFKDTPFNIIKKTLEHILNEAAWIIHARTMADDNTSAPIVPQISIRAQVPRLKGVDSSNFDKLPYHVRENRKVLHIEAKPDDEKELKDLFQFAKESNLVSLRLGKRAHISEVMDMESTPGEIKRMVKYAMGHANYQGSMTGETIVGIDLLDGGAYPSSESEDTVSLRMVLFNYFKMKDKFSVFAELHQTEEMGPVLAIIPACEEAERLVQMI